MVILPAIEPAERPATMHEGRPPGVVLVQQMPDLVDNQAMTAQPRSLFDTDKTVSCKSPGQPSAKGRYLWKDLCQQLAIALVPDLKDRKLLFLE